VADPPLLVANDGVLGRGNKRIKIGPGGVNVGAANAQGQQLIHPLHTGARLDITKEMMDIKRETSREEFLSNLLDLFGTDHPQRTATEILERAKEKGQIITPVIGRQQSENLGPMIQREIGIAQRQGALPPLPDALSEAQGDYEIVYESEATRMQKSAEAGGFQQVMELMVPFIENDASVLDKWKAEDGADHFSEVFGSPAKLLRTADEMKPIRQAQAQAAQQQAELDQLEQGSGAVRNLATVQGAA